MTTGVGSEPVITRPVAARVFLFGDQSVVELADRLADSNVLHDAGAATGALSAAGRKILDDQLAPLADSFLDVDLGGVAAAGWKLHEQLVTAARETLATPGQRSVLDLASHRIESSWHPRIELVVGARAVAHIAFELTVVFDVTGLSAGVAGGRLVQLGGGRCRVEVSFAVGGQTLAERSAQFDPQLAIPLGPGLPIPVVPEPAAETAVIRLPGPGPDPAAPAAPPSGRAARSRPY